MRPGTALSREQIDEFFEINAEELQAEGTYALSPWIRDVARAQVHLYWRRLMTIANQVTETEVRLQLPAQKSPEGRTFAIDGVVDIVREADGRTTMYDIKTHDAQLVRENRKQFERQLNVYAHIWHELRGERLDATAIVCTTLPPEVQTAYTNRDEGALVAALSRWDPIIPIDYELDRVNETITEFGKVVDKIERHKFSPRPVHQLRTKLPGTQSIFAVYVCRNCDARYSCRAYQEYALGTRSRSENAIARYLQDLGEEEAVEDFTMAALEIEPPLGRE